MTRKPPALALTIAGSDSSGGAGIQADLKTFAVFNIHCTTAITAVTAQNTQIVEKIHVLPPEMVIAQIEAVLDDLNIKAVKIGMIGSAETAVAVAKKLRDSSIDQIIIDTPLMAGSGASLGNSEVSAALKAELLPLASLITPNIHEAAVFLDAPVARTVNEMKEQARALMAFGSKAVLLKGGHLFDEFDGEPKSQNSNITKPDFATDVYCKGTDLQCLVSEWVSVKHNHGTGCALASAITAQIIHGHTMKLSIETAKLWLTECLQSSHSMGIGSGSGPLNIVKPHIFDL